MQPTQTVFLQEDSVPLNLHDLPLATSAPHKTITIPLEEVVWKALQEM